MPTVAEAARTSTTGTEKSTSLSGGTEGDRGAKFTAMANATVGYTTKKQQEALPEFNYMRPAKTDLWH